MGIIGKIFTIIGIILLVLLVIIGITAWQTYSLYSTANTESKNIQSALTAFQSGDCSKVPDIDTSIAKIKSSAESACINPIIKIAVDKLNEIPIKCQNISNLETQLSPVTNQIKTMCANQTLMNKIKQLQQSKNLPPMPSSP